DEVGRGIELGGEQHAHAHGAGPNDRHGITGLDGAIQDADFVAGGQNVAEHDQRFFIGTFGHRVQAVVGMGNAHVFGLGAVDQVAEDPAAVFAVRVHLLLAVFALAAGRDARDQHPVALLEVADAFAHFLDDADAFMAQNAPGLHRGYVALEDVQVGAADGGAGDAHDRIGGFLNPGNGYVVETAFAGAAVDNGFHGGGKRHG